MMKSLVVPAFLLLLSPDLADATFTVAGAHLFSGQIGAAGCTCVDPTSFSLYTVNYYPVPGKGLLLAQASPPNKTTSPVYPKAEELIEAGADCHAVLQDIVNPALDEENTIELFYNISDVEVRQYACVNLMGQAAGYTGPSLVDLYALRGSAEMQPQVQEHNPIPEGTEEAPPSFAFSAQGNSVSINTVPLLTEGFTDVEGCDLADRLFRSITAVDDANAEARMESANEDANFEGDVRCENGALNGFIPGFGYPGLQAYMHVDDMEGNEILHIEILPELGVNPYLELRAKYAEWRAANPCPFGLIEPSSGAETSYPPSPAPAPTSGTSAAAAPADIRPKDLSFFMGMALSLGLAFFM